LDPAFASPGRFDRPDRRHRPDRIGRRKILEVHTEGQSPLSGLAYASTISLKLARSTQGKTGWRTKFHKPDSALSF